MLRRAPCRYGNTCRSRDTCRFAHPPPTQRPPSPPSPSTHRFQRMEPQHEDRRRQQPEEECRRASFPLRHEGEFLSRSRVRSNHDCERYKRVNENDKTMGRRESRTIGNEKGSPNGSGGADHHREKSPHRRKESDTTTVATTKSTERSQPQTRRMSVDPPGEHASSLSFLSSSFQEEETPVVKRLIEPDETIDSPPTTHAAPKPAHVSPVKPPLPSDRTPVTTRASFTVTEIRPQKLQQPPPHPQTRTKAITLEDAYRYIPYIRKHLPSDDQFWSCFDEATRRMALGPSPTPQTRMYCHAFQLTHGQCRFGGTCRYLSSHLFCKDAWFHERVQYVREIIHDLKSKKSKPKNQDDKTSYSLSNSIADSPLADAKRTTNQDPLRTEDMEKQQEQCHRQQEEASPHPKRKYDAISETYTDGDSATNDDLDTTSRPERATSSNNTKFVKLEPVKLEPVKLEDVGLEVTEGGGAVPTKIVVKEEPC